jgi:hypothetical protein
MTGEYNKRPGWLSSISGLINFRKRPNEDEFGISPKLERRDIYLMADIAHQIVLRYGSDAPYNVVAERIERLVDCALDGEAYNDVTYLYSTNTPNADDEAMLSKLEKTSSHDNTKQEEALPAAKIKPNQKPEDKPQKENMISKLCKYLSANYTFRYNVLTTNCEVRRNDSEEAYIVIGKREKNTIVLNAQQAGLNCWDKDVERVINSSETALYHPFIDYFNRLPKWDGKDRVSDLAKRVSDKPLWVNGFHRWLLGATAQWMNVEGENARANCVAPLLISTEQGWGKSTFCRIILPKELRDYYTEHFDLAKETSCEQRLGDFGLINLDEFDKYSSKKMPMLKNLLQERALTVMRGVTPAKLARLLPEIGIRVHQNLCNGYYVVF